ncbi:arylamine N-acetyltransferase 1 [Microthyrium microscopicum]|uniref:Arylamine N-acetyltransferase 1 n=1 Tax=Microthyrium microscopicum TaxID=703497 RepID=A0A6A6UPN5_9PEZI|nr:arylamine N-acetyltransferase 1 [Microthyrium microscopicum]
MPTAHRHTKFSVKEIDQYFSRLQVTPGSKESIYDINEISPKKSVEYLEFLQRQHLAYIPFENLSLHYSRWRQISLHPEDLSKKIVQSPGRGGYCMELNALFATLLRSLGYKLRTCGARTHDGKKFGGWSHHVNLVTIADEMFLLDVGYGPNNPITPLSLQQEGKVVGAIHEEQNRVIQTGLEDNEDPSQKVWVYQHRQDPDGPWINCYCFTELEFRPEDFEVMNLSTSQSPRRFFTQRVFRTKMVLDESGKNIVGRLTLGRDIKKSHNGKSETYEVFATESDRLSALKKYFSIELSESDSSAIIGTIAEIK